MSNYITIPFTEIMLKAGDRVRLVEPEVLISKSNNSDVPYEIKNRKFLFTNHDTEISFKNCDVNEQMLNVLSQWDTQEIKSIDKDGDIKFVDIPYTWPKEVILEPVDEKDVSIRNYIDSSKVDYLRICKDEVDPGVFDSICAMPHAILSNDGELVCFYTISQNDVNPSKHLEP